jgi:hypothetical protein
LALLLGHGATILEESRKHKNCTLQLWRTANYKSVMAISSMTAFDGQLWTLTDTFDMGSHMVRTSHDEEGLQDKKIYGIL